MDRVADRLGFTPTVQFQANIDAAIEAAVKRTLDSVRMQHAQQRAFQGAATDRLTAGWLATQNSINQELRGDLDRLRARSRQLARDNDYARKFIKMVSANVVGLNGFALQSRVEDAPDRPDDAANAAIESAFYDWARRGVCEISGRMAFADLQRAIISAAARDGEYLVRKVRGKAAGNQYGFALQFLDIDRLDTQYNVASAAGRNAVVMGVEIDEFRRPVAYWLFESHPGDGIASSRRRVRVPADEIIHDFVPEMPEQLRGIPWMHAAMLSMHHLGEFEQSAMIAARKGANTMGFFVSPDGAVPPLADGLENDDPITVSVPGTYDTLPLGYDFRYHDSKYPDQVFAGFTKSFLRRISSGLNVAYNSLANDLEGVSFSSIRSGVLEERDQWMMIQGWFIESVLEPVFAEWLGYALLNGAIVSAGGSALPAAKREKFSAHIWQGRRWQWVDPKNDIETAVIAINNGLNSPQNIIASLGMDAEDVLADIARFQQMARDRGVILEQPKQLAPSATEPEKA